MPPQFSLRTKARLGSCGPCSEAQKAPGKLPLTKQVYAKGSAATRGSRSCLSCQRRARVLPPSTQAVWKTRCHLGAESKRDICMCVYKCMFLKTCRVPGSCSSPLTLPCVFRLSLPECPALSSAQRDSKACAASCPNATLQKGCQARHSFPGVDDGLEKS